MQTLGLASEQKPSDGMFKRLFWPTIENQYDLDLVSTQGFWVCALIGVLSTVVLLISGHIIMAPFVGLTYFLAATGVRERSVAAAVLIFACYMADRIGGLFMGQPPIGIIPIGSMLLLFANVRATLLAKRWEEVGTAEQTEPVERYTDSFTEKLSNGMPAKVWPIGRYVFFPFAAILLVLTVVGIEMYPEIHRKQVELQRQQHDGEITVTASPDK